MAEDSEKKTQKLHKQSPASAEGNLQGGTPKGSGRDSFAAQPEEAPSAGGKYIVKELYYHTEVSTTRKIIPEPEPEPVPAPEPEPIPEIIAEPLPPLKEENQVYADDLVYEELARMEEARAAESRIPAAVPPAKRAKKEKAVKEVRLPIYAAVVNKKGDKIGKIRRSVWYNRKKEYVGEFVKEDDNVYYCVRKKRKGFVDKNDNILLFDNTYAGTIRYFRWWIFLIIAAVLALVVLLSALLAAYCTPKSESPDYAPTLFIADEGGEWDETRNLEVFFNEKFGDSVIEPGQSGTYAFTFENRNADVLEYNLEFSCVNEYGIELVYRLKRDGAYIAGVPDSVIAEGLSCENLTIEGNSSTVFEIEWYWRHNDAVDTAAGTNSAQYTLNIRLVAWVKGA